MAAEPDTRRTPESFLDAARAEDVDGARRGRLKVFLGAAPGVGKTYTMLEEAKARQKLASMLLSHWSRRMDARRQRAC